MGVLWTIQTRRILLSCCSSSLQVCAKRHQAGRTLLCWLRPFSSLQHLVPNQPTRRTIYKYFILSKTCLQAQALLSKVRQRHPCLDISFALHGHNAIVWPCAIVYHLVKANCHEKQLQVHEEPPCQAMPCCSLEAAPDRR